MASPFLTAATVLALATDPACGGLPSGSEMAVRLVAVATHESSRDPLAININGARGGTRRFQTREAATAFARSLDAQGRDYDAGLLQINRRNFARHGLTLETAFDACRSMAAGAAHLFADLDAAWRAAHSRYNTGDLQRGIDNGYVAGVERALAAVRRELNPAAPRLADTAAIVVGALLATGGTPPSPTPPATAPVDPECRPPHWDVWAHCRSGTRPPPWWRPRPEPDRPGLEAAATPSVQCAASVRGNHDDTHANPCVGGPAHGRRTAFS